MRSKQGFELFQVLIIMTALRKLCSAILFPSGKKLLYRVPLPAEDFPLFLWFEWGSGSRSIPINVQGRKSGSSLRSIQHPSDFGIDCGARSDTVRRYERRREPDSEPRPENANDQVVPVYVRDVFRISLFRLILIFPEVGTQQQCTFSGAVCGQRSDFILFFQPYPIGIGDANRNV